MQTIDIGQYSVLLTGKDDGNSRDPDHWVHDSYVSICQIHENILIDADNLMPGYHPEITGDALVSTHKPLGVYIADCLPIAFMGKDTYALVHGSWKTLEQGIIQNTVKNLCRQGEGIVDICVYIGPSIKAPSYEVGEEFLELFPKHTSTDVSGKITLDMVQFVVDTLQSCALTAIDIHPDCTYTNNSKWWSWRQGDKKERNFMGIRRR